ncbi:MAG: ATP cone domain-containing protein [Archaeoglobaceae archaeon]|nr:ATP cone domain-containing protein [Archaeoglobaceae archaeon]MDW8118016.1 ATP cone domain-containing protein [Archaeoglobaceae archaeon]
MLVKKRDGRLEEFNEDKLIRTLIRAGLSEDKAELVAKEVESRIYDGINTNEILEIALEIVGKYSKKVSTVYGLKSSLLRLGPSGYRFEKFVSALLKEFGYKTITNQLIEGKCALHEIDVIAEKKKKFLIECKFHNTPTYTGLKDVLYSYARYLDIIESGKDFDAIWLFTNTKFSSDAIRYANCRGLLLTGWRYPENEGIEFMLESKKLYPITVLSLKDFEIGQLLKEGFAFCKDLVENSKKVREVLGKRGESILEEAKILQEA